MAFLLYMSFFNLDFHNIFIHHKFKLCSFPNNFKWCNAGKDIFFNKKLMEEWITTFIDENRNNIIEKKID